MALLPVSASYRMAIGVRNAAYDAGVLKSHRLPVPSIGIGNLSVGGTGKTPLTMYVAAELTRRGLRPGILLRGYGDDETAEHREANPSAVVETGADRHAAAASAVAQGAEVLVLDDALQRRDATTDVMLALVAAETWTRARWPLPSGPWREGLGALRRADAVIVTRKAAGQSEAESLARELAPRTRMGVVLVASLEPFELVPMSGGSARSPSTLRGRDVMAVAGVGEPDLFAVPFERLGARVRLVSFGDHHAYTAEDAAWIVATMPRDGVLVTTAKDAVKLASLWPAGGPECLVARLRVSITAGADALAELIDRAATRARHGNPGTTAVPSARES
jgi:tetraacyldisaccharide 4'-kinase